MSKEGLPDIAQVDGSGLRVAVVTATWNAEICDQLHAQAVQTATDNGAEVAEYRVVGALELGVVVQAAARSYDAVVALGCVIRGGTPHFEYVAGECTKGLSQVSMEFGVPVAFGVLTVDSIEQAIERSGTKAGNKGAEAALSALEMVSLLAQLEAK